MVRQVVEDLGRREPVALQLLLDVRRASISLRQHERSVSAWRFGGVSNVRASAKFRADS